MSIFFTISSKDSWCTKKNVNDHTAYYAYIKDIYSLVPKCSTKSEAMYVPIDDNDPSAGSPTETLLRLLLPLDNLVCKSLKSTTIY